MPGIYSGIRPDRRNQPNLETSAEEGDDDALIERLGARAWDPGLRFDRKHLAELYADAPQEQLQRQRR